MLADAVNTLPSYLATLNAPQRQAVETTEGPLLVLAGAGTGKTKVLTSRIAHLLMQKKAFPSQILAVTFTNKAAREMVERVAHMVGEASSGLWLGTFHSIGARILRRHAPYVGLETNFTILDADDQHRLIKQIMQEMKLEDKRWPGKVALSLIQGWKDKGLTPDKVGRTREAGFANGRLPDIYEAYQKRLLTLNAADFGDLLLHCLTLFMQNPEVLEEYARRFKYILVDEYQDTNVGQYLWLRLLAAGHQNLCCVGDDDQSIYSWRGAEVGNILKFEKDFPAAQTIRLEENYRSTPHILGAASGLIAHNNERLGKTLYTTRNDGEKVAVRAVWDEKEEARMIADGAENLQRQHESLDSIAVLVRAGFQTRAFEEQFMQQAIPYRVVGGLRFYERKEVRDIIAYLRLIQQPHDDLACERIINVPKRGIGGGTLEKMQQRARADGTSIYQAASRMLEEKALTAKVSGALKHLYKLLEEWRQQLLQERPLEQVVEDVIERTEYRAMLEAERTEESAGRLENLKELVRSTAEYPTLGAFLDHVGLVADRDNPLTEKQEMVTLMTMHAAKGLEFDTVFLPGWEEGLFPSKRSVDENGIKGLEEERRLAYVGITRAKKRAVISHASSRRVYGEWQQAVPSQFLAELPPEHIETEEVVGQGFSRTSLQQQIDAIMRTSEAGIAGFTKKPVVSVVGRVKKDADGFYVGCLIAHSSFGTGRVLSMEGNRLQICFEVGGIKTIMKEFVRLG